MRNSLQETYSRKIAVVVSLCVYYFPLLLSACILIYVTSFGNKPKLNGKLYFPSTEKASFDVGMFGLIFVPLELTAVSSILSRGFQQKRGQK